MPRNDSLCYFFDEKCGLGFVPANWTCPGRRLMNKSVRLAPENQLPRRRSWIDPAQSWIWVGDGQTRITALFGWRVHARLLTLGEDLVGQQELARMSHKGGGERRKAARSASGASSTSGNHRTGLLLRICSPSSPRM